MGLFFFWPLYCLFSFDHCIVCFLLTIVLSVFFWPLYCLFFFWPLYCLFSFDHCIVCFLLTIVLSGCLWIITSDYPLVSSNLSLICFTSEYIWMYLKHSCLYHLQCIWNWVKTVIYCKCI
jgi:hypothetical protein